MPWTWILHHWVGMGHRTNQIWTRKGNSCGSKRRSECLTQTFKSKENGQEKQYILLCYILS